MSEEMKKERAQDVPKGKDVPVPPKKIEKIGRAHV